MTRSYPVRVRPRTDGDLVPDVLGMRLAHRAMLRDANRLPDLAERLAAGTCDARRADAVARYVRDFADSVHHHHSVEDEVLWPVLAASAGPHVDLTELSDDHAALDPALARLRTTADAFRARPGEDTATALAVELADLRDTLTEHIGDEEASVFPVIERYVSVADWAAVKARIRKRAKLSFEAPRVLAVATDAERAAIEADGGPALRVLLAVLVPPFRRRERAVFGV
ncbi:hemerythrin-like domain-containing protein [Geodermatophilus tzadiensis]|uniref:Hemerythrin-like domain-containing protein n=1 Tax=Geodermatophilus tzadiensis TaxID=1137988 RepID=A0A2T0T105_9ACTN|nr:hemerythrin domain-containing protein [Geodermatophilus tzadiensis]PRY39358.1 hemerythrin-like domain-containing protein [Geodermatophilus tzadiensis]